MELEGYALWSMACYNAIAHSFSVGHFKGDDGPVTFESYGCFARAKQMQLKLGARERK